MNSVMALSEEEARCGCRPAASRCGGSGRVRHPTGGGSTGLRALARLARATWTARFAAATPPCTHLPTHVPTRSPIHAAHKLTHSRTHSRGVVTHSSGNHGAAVALAAQLRGIPAHVVVPANTPEIKRAAIRGYGVEPTVCEATIDAREAACAAIQQATGAAFCHPYNHPETIAGQVGCEADGRVGPMGRYVQAAAAPRRRQQQRLFTACLPLLHPCSYPMPSPRAPSRWSCWSRRPTWTPSWCPSAAGA